MLSRLEERERRLAEARLRARHLLFIDMLKSYAAPLILAAFVNPLLAPVGGRMGGLNYLLLLIGLVMIGYTLIFVEPKE